MCLPTSCVGGECYSLVQHTGNQASLRIPEVSSFLGANFDLIPVSTGAAKQNCCFLEKSGYSGRWLFQASSEILLGPTEPNPCVPKC